MKKLTAALLCGAMLLTGCSEKKPEDTQAHTRDLFAMDTFMTMKAYGDNAEQGLSAAAEEITTLEKLLAVQAFPMET